VSRELKFILALILISGVLWIVGCAIGTRQEWWLRPTTEIRGSTNIVTP
jgi:hypothetical protein